MSRWRIAYRAERGGVKQVQVVSADTLPEAEKKMPPMWSIVSVSMQCEAVTKDGEPCQRWHGGRGDYCASHEHLRLAVPAWLDTAMDTMRFASDTGRVVAARKDIILAVESRDAEIARLKQEIAELRNVNTGCVMCGADDCDCTP